MLRYCRPILNMQSALCLRLTLLICVITEDYITYMPSVLWRCWLGGRKGIRPVKNWVVRFGVVICLEQDADLHMAQLMPLPLTVSCFTHTHTHLTALCPGLPRWAGTRKVKPIWILLKQETVSGSGISWAICKSAHRSRQITMPAPHHF